LDRLDYVIAQSDYLVLALPLTEQTRHLLNEENLTKNAKSSMVLINIGRGALVDEDGLIRCLEKGTIAGAALDVFTVEPLPETSKLWTTPNVLISCHNADLTEDSRKRSVRYFAENCKKFLQGEKEFECLVDKTKKY
jgi:phosphoglycerate dehydrogenase-like enzyme